MTSGSPVMRPAPTGATRVVGVIGHPVRHSLSPVLHNAAFAEAGLDWTYVAFPVEPGQGAAAVDAVRALSIEGLSVTMPHKTDVAGALDELTAHASLLGSVNTVTRKGDLLVGDSTDGYGFLAGLADAGFDPRGRTCAVLGAGGAGRAVVLALAQAGASNVLVVNRSRERAEQAVSLAPGVAVHATAAMVSGADLVVNATPMGMGQSAGVPLDPSLLSSAQFVNDLIYHPFDTELLADARARGATTLNGLPMLVHQAARQFTLWTGVEAPVEAMRAAVTVELAARA